LNERANWWREFNRILACRILSLQSKWRQQMIVEEVIHTCSDANVASGALASIGGEFAEDFAARASRFNLSPGMLVVLIVKAFSDQASPDQRNEIWRLAHGTDQPILSGLRHILAQSTIFESSAL
jgi:hypothetical protein